MIIPHSCCPPFSPPSLVQPCHALSPSVEQAKPASGPLAAAALPEQLLPHGQQEEQQGQQLQHALQEVDQGPVEEELQQGWPGEGQEMAKASVPGCEAEQKPGSVCMDSVPAASAAPSVQEDVPSAPAIARADSADAASAPFVREPEEEDQGFEALEDNEETSTAVCKVGAGASSAAWALSCKGVLMIVGWPCPLV